ncbi:hypothetical protein FB561_7055 [Kribbella amoyensis]|uniref:Uncharacterized protein n=1 Tax=Kribbella amoyensis TaxID=996641 RepID=A0A561B2T3_9ACTN|nr:hypothetical protein [Kribbella amoyensis]TWD73170.1 hypothetical protein FB561_7055 [Kribbella amoyensis]
MTYDVVVLIEREMSEGDAQRVAALHARDEEPVSYHLLISSHPTEGFAGPLALLGSSFAEVAGLTGDTAPGRTTTATALADPQYDLASVIERSSRRLRAATNSQVNVSITHGEILLALRRMLTTTNSEEVIVVAWPETAAAFVCSDWARRAKKQLHIPHLRVLEHDR